jgi:hypothetical protein
LPGCGLPDKVLALNLNLFTKAYANGLTEYFVELEGVKSGITQFEGVKWCFDYLNHASFVK